MQPQTNEGHHATANILNTKCNSKQMKRTKQRQTKE